MSFDNAAVRPLWEELQHDLLEKIDTTQKEEPDHIRRETRSLAISQHFFDRLDHSVIDNPLASEQESIVFCKDILPFFYGRVIFFGSALRFEVDMPVGDRQIIDDHFQKEWRTIREFHSEQRFLVGYLRSGQTWLDDKFFTQLPPRPSALPASISLSPGTAPLLAAHIQAKDLMQVHLLDRTEELSQHRDPSQRNMPRLTWTDSKAALIELAYALQSAGSLNDRKADLREIIECLQVMFHVDLGHYPRVFQEILCRKSGYTNYIDKLRDKLLLRIKRIEEKYDPK